MNLGSRTERSLRLRDRLREETVRAIAEAAEQVFACRGVDAAKMDEIARQAGVAVGTLYNHFPNREALLNGLVEARRKELAERLDAALAASARKPFGEQLRNFVDTVFDHFQSHRSFLSIMLESDTASLSRPSPAMREIRAHVDALVQRGLEQRALKQEGRELWPVFLMSAVKALLINELRNPGQTAQADAVVSFFLEGAGE